MLLTVEWSLRFFGRCEKFIAKDQIIQFFGPL